jgi:Uma2 family endonuclease
MSIAVREVLTLEQFLKLPEIKPPLEFLRGRIEQKVSPNLHHSILSDELRGRINHDTMPARTGRAFVELRCSFGGESFVPNVCFFARGRLPKDSKGHYAEQVLLPPDLAVEILSPGQTVSKLSARLNRCLQKGVRMAWLIQPRRQRVLVFLPGRPPRELGPGDVLEGEDVLPGFALPLDELFGWLVADD